MEERTMEQHVRIDLAAQGWYVPCPILVFLLPVMHRVQRATPLCSRTEDWQSPSEGGRKSPSLRRVRMSLISYQTHQGLLGT
jgi:hypothetical protein